MNQTSLYESLSANYESPANASFYRALALRLTQGLDSGLQGPALDLACGSGFSTKVLTETFDTLAWQGADASARMLELARTKPELGQVRFEQARAEELPYRDGEFSAVSCNFGFHWFGERALPEIERVLRPGGLLLMTVPLLHPQSQASGNLWLRRRLLENRHLLRESRSQGFLLEDLRAQLAHWNLIRAERQMLAETFTSETALFQSLKSRGSWDAIFGPAKPEFAESNASQHLEFEWAFAVIQADRP